MVRKKGSTRSPLPDFVVVKDSEGITGTIPDPKNEAELSSEITVHLDHGGAVSVPGQLLERRMLGSGYVFKGAFAEFYDSGRRGAGDAPPDQGRRDVSRSAAPEQPPPTATSEHGDLVIPVMEEELRVGRKRVETGKVRISKVVRERSEVIEEPVFGEDVEVKRVPVDRAVDEPPPVRMEGDVMVIPLLEERVVTRKQLFLKEELHVIKRQYETTSSQEVTLRSEEAIVEDVGPEAKQPADKKVRRRGAGR